MSKARWTGRSRGTPGGYRIFIFMIRVFGVRGAYALLWLVVPYYVLTARKSNRAIRAYFDRVRSMAPHAKGLSPFRSYLALGRSIIDSTAIRHGLSERFRMSHEGQENLTAMADGGTGGLLISAHIGNWDLAGQLLGNLRDRISVVMLDREHARIKEALQGGTTGPPYQIIPLKEDLSHLFLINGALAEGRLLCFHGDRSLPGSRVLKGPLLGKMAEFPAGPFAVAATHGVPVAISFVLRTGPMTYRLQANSLVPAGADAQTIFQRFLAELEKVVLDYPLQWFNYYDFWGDDPPHAPGRS